MDIPTKILFGALGFTLLVPFLISRNAIKYGRNAGQYFGAILISCILMTLLIWSMFGLRELWWSYEYYQFSLSAESADQSFSEGAKYERRRFGDGGRNVFFGIILPFLAGVYSILVISAHWIVARVRALCPALNKSLNSGDAP
jgi:hypothetical protein